jgi:hypothetical protein
VSIDKRFALIDRDGDRRYPYIKGERGTGRHGFAIGRDRHGKAEYTTDLRRVIQAVVLEGLGVRARPEESIKGKNGNTVGLSQRAIESYWLAPEFFPLVAQAKFQPINRQEAKGHAEFAKAEAALVFLEALTADNYSAALDALVDKISTAQRAVLVGHASAGGRTLSMSDIAELGGYASYEAANTQYGELGRLFADYFDLDSLENATQAIATIAPPGADGQWRWKLRPQLVQAMLDLGLIEGKVDALGRGDAEREIDADPRTQGVPETTRQALINARIGQGGYRQRMLHIWGGKCAVSGCGLESVLIASHAKAWKDSSNDERLDEYNGLLLAASIDRLFDSGLIAFGDDGALLVGSKVSREDLAVIGLSGSARLRSIHPRHKPYLQEHRKKFGFDK